MTGLVQFSYQAASIAGPAAESFRLIHVDAFPKVCIKKSIVNIRLLDVKVVMGGQSKQKPQCVELPTAHNLSTVA